MECTPSELLVKPLDTPKESSRQELLGERLQTSRRTLTEFLEKAPSELPEEHFDTPECLPAGARGNFYRRSQASPWSASGRTPRWLPGAALENNA